MMLLYSYNEYLWYEYLCIFVCIKKKKVINQISAEIGALFGKYC